jgi:putative tryptophan/tyrosine transport system substrate-binding protein
VGLIGLLTSYPETDPSAQFWVAAFRGALTKLWWTERRNLRIEPRWRGGDADEIRTLAEELIKLRPDTILGVTTPLVGVLAKILAAIIANARLGPNYSLPDRNTRHSDDSHH